jgi:carbamoyltransferase
MTALRIEPRFPRLGRAAFAAAHWCFRKAMKLGGFHAPGDARGREILAAVWRKLEAGETVHIAGVGCPGLHNTGIAIVEVTRERGPRLIVNNEEERFSGVKHTLAYPELSIRDACAVLESLGLDIHDIDAWVTTWDYPSLIAMGVRSMAEEMPASFKMLKADNDVAMDFGRVMKMLRSPRTIARQLGLPRALPMILMPHHHNHAWFSFAASPFDDSTGPVAIAVLDGTGDNGSISHFVSHRGEMTQLYSNDSLFDSVGCFYSVIASTQGGWTWLSCEGRYMGASAWGDTDRASNRYYKGLREVFHFGEAGTVRLNRSLARWHSDMFEEPYSDALIELLGRPLQPHELWNPDAVLSVEDIQHRPDTQDRLDKAAATQMVFEDVLIHVIGHLLRTTGAHRLVLTGGVALNAVANMRLLEHFDEDWFERETGRRTRLHLWVPPTPGDAGVTIGAAWQFARMAGAVRGAPMSHAFYCGAAPSAADIAAALDVPDIVSTPLGDVSTPGGCREVADLIAFLVEKGCVVALYQGAAETGPRALGHRSILANPCSQGTREALNARVKFREAIRPLAPMMTLESAQEFFELQEGASDAGYNAYNYMVLTARARPHAREVIPAVIHADGTGRLQIVREDDDPLTHAYLKALGRRIGVEVSVNTSFNVGGPIAQTPDHAVATLRRAKGLDAVIMIASDGSARAMCMAGERDTGRFAALLEDWRQDALKSA